MTKQKLNDDALYDAFCGDKPLPVNVSLNGDFAYNDGTPGSVEFTQNIWPYEEATGVIQQVIDLIEQDSLNEPGMPFREVASFIFVYEDGSAQAQCYTSNLHNHVTGQDTFNAITNARILDELDEGKIPRRIIHVHSHPGYELQPENERGKPVIINDSDYRAYQSLSAFFSHYAGKQIPLTGLVRPVGKDCGNVIIETQAGPNDPEHNMMIRANVMKGQRALARALEVEISP